MQVVLIHYLNYIINIFLDGNIYFVYHNNNRQGHVVRNQLEYIIMLGRDEISPIVIYRPFTSLYLKLIYPCILHQVNDVLGWLSIM